MVITGYFAMFEKSKQLGMRTKEKKHVWQNMLYLKGYRCCSELTTSKDIILILVT
jgi:hypothetical protein